MRGHNLELDMILRGIVMTRGEDGATISEMRNDYYNIVCEPWPLKYKSTDQIIQYLLEIDGLIMEQFESGLCIWYIDDIGNSVSQRVDSNNNIIAIDSTITTESSHETEQNSYVIPAPRTRQRMMSSSLLTGHAPATSSSSDTLLIETICEKVGRKRNLSNDSPIVVDQQKRAKLLTPSQVPLIEKNLDIHNRNNGSNLMIQKTTSTELEKSNHADYIIPINEHDTQQLRANFNEQCQINEKTLSSMQTESIEHEPIFEAQSFYGCGIIGDDFMRSLISFELFGSDHVDQNYDRFGICISGQTVCNAFNLVLDKQRSFAEMYRNVIVNVGAIDILMDRDLIDIEAEFARLIKAIIILGLNPIITTIPKIHLNWNNPNAKQHHQTLLLFNNFLMNTYSDGYHFIDLYSRLSSGNDSKCYHTQPKCVPVGNTKLQLWRWAPEGRSRILHAIESFVKTHNIAQC